MYPHSYDLRRIVCFKTMVHLFLPVAPLLYVNNILPCFHFAKKYIRIEKQHKFVLISCYLCRLSPYRRMGVAGAGGHPSRGRPGRLLGASGAGAQPGRRPPHLLRIPAHRFRGRRGRGARGDRLAPRPHWLPHLHAASHCHRHVLLQVSHVLQFLQDDYVLLLVRQVLHKIRHVSTKGMSCSIRT
jgi:hypothetical protein